MKQSRYIVIYLISIVTAVGLAGCGGTSGYSSVGVSHGSYWGPYRTYRPSYHYNYHYRHDHRHKDYHRGSLGRPKNKAEKVRHRPRPERRPSGARPPRRR